VLHRAGPSALTLTLGRTVVLLLAVTCACTPGHVTPAAAPGAKPNILLVTIDTLRADRLGRGFTPTLDRLAAEGLNFTQARAAVPLTLPSHATILSGLLPPHHGVRENATYRFDRAHPTIASLLKARGYRTAAVVGAYVLDRQFGLDVGFDSYDDRIPRNPDADLRLESERRATAVTDAALAALDALSLPSRTSRQVDARSASVAPTPFFLWVHYYDPHAPYDPPPAFAARANGDPYNGEIAYVDAELARLLDGVRQRFDRREPGSGPGRDAARASALDRMAIVVAGDHGESLGEHGERTHGMLLYEPALRVPLIIRSPRTTTPVIRSDPASLVDIAPTLAALAGVSPAPKMDGINLLRRTVEADREVYGETNYPRAAGWSPLRSLISRSWKLVRTTPLELFDVARDPGETDNLAGKWPAIAAAMAARVAEFETTSKQAATAPSAEAQDRLRALGYVAASPSVQTDSSAPNPAREIAAWGEFEDALTDVASGRGAAALPRLRGLSTRYPTAQVFQKVYAQALLDAGRAADGLVAFRTIVARWPGESGLLHDLAVAARAAGRADEASRAEQAALVVDTRYPAAYNGLGLIQVDAGRFAEAAASFERATSLEPSDPSYWTNLGNARRELGDPARATEAYRRALAIDDGWPDAANGLGVQLVQGGRAAEAIPWFEKALGRSPGFVEAKLNLGIALQQAGQVERAKAAYRQVLAAPQKYRQQRDAAAKLLAGLR
jgi:arylsulfatase A-like enzyme/Tfp pilus assembly protein PilF